MRNNREAITHRRRGPNMTTETADAAAWEQALIADMRAGGGRPTQGPLAGHPLMLLYSIGVKSGQRRRSILTYSRDGDAYVVAGTAGGSKVDPAWIANVAKDPDVEVEVANEVFPARATIHASGPERDRLWAQHVAQLPWFGDYPSQVGGRVIPVVVLRRA
jgi:deazaflavin-dependent oxidoreductase (nitroreductase family)